MKTLSITSQFLNHGSSLKKLVSPKGKNFTPTLSELPPDFRGQWERGRKGGRLLERGRCDTGGARDV